LRFTITAKHIHSKMTFCQLILLFCLPYPSDRLSCFNKTKQKQIFQQVRFLQWIS